LIYERDPDRQRKLIQKRGSKASLLLQYLRHHIDSGKLRSYAAPVLRKMVAQSGTRKPPISHDDLLEQTKLPSRTITGILFQLRNEGLVRSLGGDLWEVSHEFLAPLLNVVLVRIERSLFRLLRPWIMPAAILIWMGAVGGIVLLAYGLEREKDKAA